MTPSATTSTEAPERHAQGPTGVATAPTLADIGVAIGATAAAIAVSLASREVGAYPPDAVAMSLLVLSGVSLVARRRWPVGVLLTVTALTSLYLARDHPGGAELPLLMVVLYTAVAEDRRAVGLTAFAALVLWHSGFRLVVDRDDPLLVVVTASLLVLVVALGEATRLRRHLRHEAQERVRAVEQQKAHEARVYITTERLRLARELHDVLAHTITAITVQAGALADGLEPGSDAREALTSIRTTSREAMRQLEATITVLRADAVDAGAGARITALAAGTPAATTSRPPPPSIDAPGISDLPELTGNVERTSGLQVALRVGDDVESVPTATGLAAYRLVQEALTNVIRHADASRVEVVVERADGHLAVRIVDDGIGATEAAGDGFGLVGMRERAHALGGQFHAGRGDGGGFVVHASLPLEHHA